MDYKFFVVKLAHPYKYNDVINEFDMFNLSDKEEVCIYLGEHNKRHDDLITLTPVSNYAIRFPIDSIKEKDLRKEKNKLIFDFPSGLNKIHGFAKYVNDFMYYLELCKNYPNKYYLQFGRNKVQYKKDNYFLNDANYLYIELINMIFRGSWEYEDLELKKHNIIRRLFS